MSILTKTTLEGISRLCCTSIYQPPWWFGFSLSLLLPSCVLSFLSTGPHDITEALIWTWPMWLLIAMDRFSPKEQRAVPSDAPDWFFDGLLYILVLLQLSNVLALGWLVARLEWTSWPAISASLANLLVIRLLAGPNFCCAAICPAHELIHRRGRFQQLLGRLLLITVCYDQFYLAHQRAHHAQRGSAQDPSTAQPDENFKHFFRRAVVQQWRIAWQTQRRSVIQGVTIELGGLALYGWLFGPLALLVFLNQAYHGIRVLEAVNYFQHYGLIEKEERLEDHAEPFTKSHRWRHSKSGDILSGNHVPAIAWRNDSAISLFLFLGLTRHTDHHQRPGIHYSQLRASTEGPMMPLGYLGMAMMVLRRDQAYRRMAMRVMNDYIQD
jgi:alkane 1-monooxygenase